MARPKLLKPRQTLILNGIVLRVFPCQDASLVVRILSPEFGKVSAIAKHVRKSHNRFPSSIDLFDQGMFRILTSNVHATETLGMIEEFTSGPSLSSPIRSNIDKLTLASLLCECFDLLTTQNDSNSQNIYALLKLAMEALAQSAEIRSSFRATFLALHGLLVESGHAATDDTESPSKNALLRLIARIEANSERKLLTKGALQEVIAQHFA